MKIGFECGCLLLVWWDESQARECGGVSACPAHERSKDFGVTGKVARDIRLDQKGMGIYEGSESTSREYSMPPA